MQPLQRSSRIEVIDAMRGFALFGILMVNMHYFSHPIETQLILPGAGPLDRATGLLIRLLFEGKFYPLFSFLFGLGVAIQRRRAEENGISMRPLLYRRMLVLLLFGVAHGVLLWTGDILTLYAICGLALITFFFRTASRTNIIWALVLVGVLNLFLALGVVGVQASLANPVTADEIVTSFADDATARGARVANDYEVYRGGSWREITAERADDFLSFTLTASLFSAPVVLAMFLIGLAFGQHRVFADLDRHRKLMRRVARIGIPLGLALNVVYAALASELAMTSPLTWSTFFAFFAYTVGGPLLTLGYISGITLAYGRSANARAFLNAFAPAGRMALTNYLLHSVIWTTLFYGYGGGLLGRVGLALGLLLTITTIALQLVISKWWLSRYRYGPVEWLWRRLTYGTLSSSDASRRAG
jgi:uncharacterized protein